MTENEREEREWSGERRLELLEAFALGYVSGNPKARPMLFNECPLHKWSGPLRHLARAIERGDKKNSAHLLGIKQSSLSSVIDAISAEHRRINQAYLSDHMENLAGLLRVSAGMANSKQLEQRLKDLEEIATRLKECRDEARTAEALGLPGKVAS